MSNEWRIVVETPPFPGLLAWVESFTKTSDQQALTPGLGVLATDVIAPQGVAGDDDQVRMTVQLMDPITHNPIEQVSIVAPWSQTQGLGNQIARRQQLPVEGGFTANDRIILGQIATNTVVTNLLDQLSLAEITRGPQGGTASIHVAAAGYGVIVRIATVPDELVPNTPDGDYWFPSLAVVRVFRNADLWLRIPVHTSNKMCSFFGDRIILGIPDALVAEWFLNLTVQVSFREGVTGQAFVMTLP